MAGRDTDPPDRQPLGDRQPVAGHGRRQLPQPGRRHRGALPDIDAESALAAYLADNGPLTPAATQRAVDVHVPGGAPASYVAGTTYALDLSSWSYSTPSDPQDTVVDVSVAGRPIGTFAVDNTLTDDAYDAHGSVAVRATLPADLPAGPATVTVVGRTTGTTVQRSITVTAAPTPPAPDPTPTPVPTPTPTPTPVPTPCRRRRWRR